MRVYDYTNDTVVILGNPDEDHFLCEIDTEDCWVGQAAKIHGDYYYAFSGGANGSYVCVRRINDFDIEGEETYLENEIKCPYCRLDVSDSFELCDADERYECPHCGGYFSYQREVEVTYSASPVEPPIVAEFS